MEGMRAAIAATGFVAALGGAGCNAARPSDPTVTAPTNGTTTQTYSTKQMQEKEAHTQELWDRVQKECPGPTIRELDVQLHKETSEPESQVSAMIAAAFPDKASAPKVYLSSNGSNFVKGYSAQYSYFDGDVKRTDTVNALVVSEGAIKNCSPEKLRAEILAKGTVFNISIPVSSQSEQTFNRVCNQTPLLKDSTEPTGRGR